MRDPEQLPSLLVVLHGMVVSAIRFTHADAHGLSHKDVEALVTKSRNLVVLNAMDSLAVENLQGLIMIAFTDVSFHSMLAGLCKFPLTRALRSATAMLQGRGQLLVHLRGRSNIYS
jgi:hypothetical protein